MKSKNLIIIIGNGFDLAHGLKTSYNYFAEHLIHIIANKCIEIKGAENLFEYSCPIISDEFINSYQKLVSSGVNPIPHKYDNSNELGLVHFLLSRLANPEKIAPFLLQNPELLREILKNQFLIKLFQNEHKNWFDIENSYFTNLKNIFKDSQGSDSLLTKLTMLNNEFEEIKNYLLKYLKTIKPQHNSNIDKFLTNEILGKKYTNIFFLNFNYTSTVNLYLRGFHDVVSNISHNTIHGSLENEIIFGYGNDNNKEYQEMKDSEEDEYLTHFKTFRYLENGNYSDLYNNFLDNYDDYEAMILGHSLGSTDKTLLKEVLDNPKCQKIYLYKRNDLKTDVKAVKNEYRKLCFSLSRIISNDNELRKKVLNFEESRFFPE